MKWEMKSIYHVGLNKTQKQEQAFQTMTMRSNNFSQFVLFVVQYLK